MKTRLPLTSGASWALCGLLCGAWGCGGSPPADVRLTAAHQNLKSLSIAYMQATTELKRPPLNADELKPFVAKHSVNLNNVLRSAVDGAELVIQWGADLSKMKCQDGKYPIWAYETNLHNGKRWVLQARDPVEISEDEFKNSTIAPVVTFAPVRKKR